MSDWQPIEDAHWARVVQDDADVEAEWTVCRDLKQWQDSLGVQRSDLPPDPADEHHALADAVWGRYAFDVLRDHEQRFQKDIACLSG